ncbi:MAG: transposase [Bacteroidota bacterium]
MGRKYAIRNQNAIYFITCTVVNWIELFTRGEYRKVVIESLKYYQLHKGLNVHAYCIMTSHIHLILSAEDGYDLSSIIRDFKSYTSTQLKKSIEESPKESRESWLIWMFERAGKKNKRNSIFQLWQQHNHPIELNTNEIMNQRLNYVHNNPLEAGFVDDPNAWVWSSCAAYERNDASEIELVFIE